MLAKVLLERQVQTCVRHGIVRRSTACRTFTCSARRDDEHSTDRSPHSHSPQTLGGEAQSGPSTQPQHDVEDRVSAEEAGMSQSASRRSTTRSAANTNQSFEETFAELLRIPKPQPSTNLNSEPVRMPDVPIRQRKGVHSRTRRAEGQTPAEAQTFNTILSEIFSDLERSGPLRGGSSPSNNVFGLKSNQSSTYQPKIWGGDRAALRRQGLMERHTKDTDETLLDQIDRLKEDMSHIDSDSVLLTWSKLHVFNPTIDAYGDPQFPPTYSPLLAHLLHVVRINLNRPHLALALFHYAQSHSPESYLTGCLAPAYNEILHVRWESFRDLAGIDQGVQEMDVNGVRWDVGTRQAVSRVVNDVLASPQAYGVGALDIVNRLEKRIEQDLDEQKDVYHLMRGSSKPRSPVVQAPVTVTTADISHFVP